MKNNQHRTESSKPGFFLLWNNLPRLQVLISGALGQFPSWGCPGSTSLSAAPAPRPEVFPENSPKIQVSFAQKILELVQCHQNHQQSPPVNQKILIKHEQQKHNNTFGHPKRCQSIIKVSQQSRITPKSHGVGMLLPTARALGRKLLPMWDREGRRVRTSQGASTMLK